MTVKFILEDFPREEILEYLKRIQEAPELKEKTRWIPTTEKLPVESDLYFVTVRDEDLGYTTANAYYLKHEDQWRLDDEWVDGEVIAWMPRPEPYKPESEVEE